ncbi:hypothetical protein POVWA2_051110 [Plasmodium ovale wallikeri]|uniref:Uncharacterized protein n=1 Tax=Plasmodium ovale wallikeri TaxID=864142 RepID=A0A1A8ZQ30_PLAOA|nr:hypothetical protein POVWA2_051110 [Plasmodium ovale wallikeri]
MHCHAALPCCIVTPYGHAETKVHIRTNVRARLLYLPSPLSLRGAQQCEPSPLPLPALFTAQKVKEKRGTSSKLSPQKIKGRRVEGWKGGKEPA